MMRRNVEDIDIDSGLHDRSWWFIVSRIQKAPMVSNTRECPTWSVFSRLLMFQQE